MLKKIAIFTLTILPVVLIAGKSYAHVLQSSGSVGAVMHISPDDAPVAGVRSDFFFEFKDKKDKFDPKICNCTVSIIEADKPIFSSGLFSTNSSPSLDNASFSFTFPRRDVYEVRITGEPRDGKTFTPFTLTYDIRVEKEAEDASSVRSSKSNENWVATHIPYVIGVPVVFIILAFVIKRKIEQLK